MKNYELTLILGDGPEAKQKKTLDKLEKLASSLGGRVVDNTSWGKKDLSYPIKKVSSGIYYFLDLMLPSEAAPVINRELEIDDDVLRHLLVVAEKVRVSNNNRVLSAKPEITSELVKEEKVKVEKPKKDEKKRTIRKGKKK